MKDSGSHPKGYSLYKELSIALITAIIINSIIAIISITLSCNFLMTYEFISIYYAAIFGFLAIYATVIAISTNLSQEFPLKISLKYIVYSRLSLSFLLTLAINILFVYTLFIWGSSININQLILLVSVLILFIFTIFFILSLMGKFKIEKHLKFFFDDMLSKFFEDFTFPRVQNIKNYDVIENEEFFLFSSTKDFPQETRKINIKDTAKEVKSDVKLSKAQASEGNLPSKVLPIYIGKGKVKIKDWDFLNQINFPINIRINKYEFGDDAFSYQVICEYFSQEDKNNFLTNLLRTNITYKELPLEEFKEVYNKLSKNGTEEKLIELIKKHIANQVNLLERRFLFSSFEAYFKEIAKSNIDRFDMDGYIGLEISNLYEQKELFFSSPAIIAKLQDKLLNTLINGFQKLKSFSPRLNTSGLYIKEFLDIRYINNFKKTQDQRWIQEYDYLISNTIKNVFLLCKSLMDMDLSPQLKKDYVVEQIGNLNRTLEHYEHFDGTDIIEDYYNLKFNQHKSELENQLYDLAERKLELIKKQKEHLKEKQSELFYLILYYIDNGKLQKDFFEVALKIYNLNGFEERYYQYERIDKLDWLNYNWFVGGVQPIPTFNFNKYRLLISFYKYIKSGTSDISKFEKENFSDVISTFEKELDSLNEELVSKYFDFDKKKLNQFKSAIKKEIKNKLESIKKDRVNYIINTPLKEEYVNQFKIDFKTGWEKSQNELSKFMEIKKIENGEKIKTFFGQYIMFPKEWFLDSFDKNVALSRDSGKDFGEDQSRNKLRRIMELINQSYDKSKDKEIEIKDLSQDLIKMIEPNKEYYLFYGQNLEIYGIPNLKWEREALSDASLTLNNSVIFFCHSHNPESLLFEKNTFILKQYSKGYENIDEELVVQIETIDDENEVKKIIKNADNLKSPEDVKQMVKIRIAEKFEIERKPQKVLIRLNTQNA